jgi:hypothetical protein
MERRGETALRVLRAIREDDMVGLSDALRVAAAEDAMPEPLYERYDDPEPEVQRLPKMRELLNQIRQLEAMVRERNRQIDVLEARVAGQRAVIDAQRNRILQLQGYMVRKERVAIAARAMG